MLAQPRGSGCRRIPPSARDADGNVGSWNVRFNAHERPQLGRCALRKSSHLHVTPLSRDVGTHQRDAIALEIVPERLLAVLLEMRFDFNSALTSLSIAFRMFFPAALSCF